VVILPGLFPEKEEWMARATSRVRMVVVPGPLAPFVDAYRAELSDRGYTPLTAVNELRQVARLSRRLEADGLTAADLSRERVGQFLAVQRAGGHGATLPGLVCLLDVLRGAGVLEAERPVARSSSPTDVLLLSFRAYLLRERGVVPGTADAYVACARRFLDGLSSEDALVGLTAREVTEAVLRESTVVSASAARYFVTALRSFLRFCFVEGLLEADLSPATLTVRSRRRSLLPKRISRTDARVLLGGCDRRSAVGRRDYGVIITLLRLGLRASELAGLTVDDIDWRAAELVVRGKGGRVDRLPLPADVGAAIAAYLRRGRPRSARREVFLRALAPVGPLGRGGVSAIVRRACGRAGIAAVGSHRLRHTAACEMVSAQVPLVQIGQVLRHRSLQSTAIYARVDLDQLRLLAQPWPGGAQR
jgi:integrase/recombinase XerD